MNGFMQFAPLLMGVPPTDGSAGGGSGQLFTTFITFGLVILIFYFLIIRPQSKRQKETKRMIETLKKGDRVVTVGGIRGLVVSVKDEVVILKVDDNTKLELNKSAVSNVVEQAAAKQEGKKAGSAQSAKVEKTEKDTEETEETEETTEERG